VETPWTNTAEAGNVVVVVVYGFGLVTIQPGLFLELNINLVILENRFVQVMQRARGRSAFVLRL
jgi:hypothetical protein